MLFKATKTISITLKLPYSDAEKLEKKARIAGMHLEEYILELALEDLDPSDRSREYVEAAECLLDQAREELEKGDVSQATEKIWGAAALAIKAYAMHKESRRLVSHGELWEYMRKMVRELGSWIRRVWMSPMVCIHVSTRGGVLERMLRKLLKR